MATPDLNTVTSAAENVTERVRDAQAAAQDGIAEAVRRGGAAVQDARDAMSELDDALRRTITERPYTALACAVAVGFLYAVSGR